MRNKKYILTDNDYKNISKKLKDDITTQVTKDVRQETFL